MKPWRLRAARFARDVLYPGGLMLVMAAAFLLAVLGWTTARDFLGRLIDKPDKRAMAG